MRTLPSNARSDSFSETSGEDGSVTAAFAREDYYQELINRANSVSIMKLFQHYGVRLDAHNKKTTCPFKSHLGGRERTASFWYYSDTNSFNCYGCSVGGNCCNFVMQMENCTRLQAAYKILKMFESSIDEDSIFSPQDLKDRLQIMMDFSNTVREFYQTYATEEAAVYVEAACQKFDALNLKHEKLENNALRRVVEQLKDYIKLYD